MLEHPWVFPVVDATHSPRKKILEITKTTDKNAAFSIHSNEFILAGDIFIIVSPPPPPPPPVMLRRMVAQWYNVRNEIER